jgi:putative hydrolase of the HAD superfamily
LPRWQIEQLLNAVPRFLTPIQETLDLIRAIRHTDNKLFILSNMHRASIAYLEQTYDIWDLFDGVVISSRIQKVKPEREIYEYLLTRHRLDAAHTVFIDDLSENLVAAAATGIQTIRFVDADQCRRDLAAFGCF